MLPPSGQHQPLQAQIMVCSMVWLKPQMFVVCTLLRFVNISFYSASFFEKVNKTTLSHFSPQGQYGNYQQWEMVTAIYSTQLCSDHCLSFDLRSTAKQTLSMVSAHWDCLRHLHTRTQNYKIHFLPSLFGLLSLPIICIQDYHVHWHNHVKVHDSPSGLVCLKAAMP